MRTRLTKIGLLLLCLVLTACSGINAKPPANGTAIDRIDDVLNQSIHGNSAISAASRSKLPASVQQALMPTVTVDMPNAPKSHDRHFDVAVNAAPARDFFMGLVKGTHYNMVVSPEIQGTISLSLKNVTVLEVLDAVRDSYGYDFEQTDYGFRVQPPHLQSRLFSVNYLNIERSGASRTSINSVEQLPEYNGGDSSTSTSSTSTSIPGTDNGRATAEGLGSDVVTRSHSDFWSNLRLTLESLVGSEAGRSVVVNPQAGVVVVRAFPQELKRVADYLDSVQGHMDRQVIIEAKIIEVVLGKDYQSGINWNLIGVSQAGRIASTTLGSGLKAFTGIFQINESAGNDFNVLLRFLAEQGNVQVLSSPHVSTVNNQKAVIKVGDDQYFVTGVTNGTVTLASNTTENRENIDLTPFFSGIALDVTPQIDNQGNVTLHIHPSVSTVTPDEVKVTLDSGNEQKLPTAKSTIRESDSVVHAKSGQVVVIGGLMENKTNEQQAGLPFLSKAPIIGGLFRDTQQSSTRSELVILLKPIVVGKDTWSKQLAGVKQRVKNLKEGFHFGAYPKEFGTEGEGS